MCWLIAEWMSYVLCFMYIVLLNQEPMIIGKGYELPIRFMFYTCHIVERLVEIYEMLKCVENMIWVQTHVSHET